MLRSSCLVDVQPTNRGGDGGGDGVNLASLIRFPVPTRTFLRPGRVRYLDRPMPAAYVCQR